MLLMAPACPPSWNFWQKAFVALSSRMSETWFKYLAGFGPSSIPAGPNLAAFDP